MGKPVFREVIVQSECVQTRKLNRHRQFCGYIIQPCGPVQPSPDRASCNSVWHFAKSQGWRTSRRVPSVGVNHSQLEFVRREPQNFNPEMLPAAYERSEHLRTTPFSDSCVGAARLDLFARCGRSRLVSRLITVFAICPFARSTSVPCLTSSMK